MIKCKELSKTYITGKETVDALKKVDFDIEKGKFTVILGPSGSGKSTLLNVLGGMDKCSFGNVIVDGEDISGYSENELTNYRRETIGFVFQFYNLISSLTAYENIEIVSRLSSSPLNSIELLKKVGLEHRLNHFPSEMSGGELQRLAIARALSKRPKLLLCDEPTGALDSKTGVSILELLQNMTKNSGMTVIVVTHNSLIAPIADRVIRLKDGSIESMEDNTDPISIREVQW